MKLSRTTIASLAIAALSFGVAAMLYDQLPDSLPIHWNIHGRVDHSLPKPWGVFIYPCIIGFTALLAVILPMISPRGFRVESFARAFTLIMAAMVVTFTCMMAAVFAGTLGLPVPVDRVVPTCIGVMFAVIGNFMGKTRQNFFIGIKTPWTLANEEVWLRTHRLGGRLFVISGLALVGAGVLGLDPLIPLMAVIAAAIVPIVYSFVIYRQLESQTAHPEEG